MTVVVAIFDDPSHLDRAVEALSEHGLDETVFDRAILAQEPFGGTPYLHGFQSAIPGHVPDEHSHSPVNARDEAVKLFRTHLAEYRVPDAAIESYATSFAHGGKFVLVRVDPARLEEVTSIFKEQEAAQVHWHR